MSHSHATRPIMQAAEREEDLLREQRHHPQEPQSMSATDPITGNDIGNLEGKPLLVVGNRTMYFESEQTRQAYLEEKHQH